MRGKTKIITGAIFLSVSFLSLILSTFTITGNVIIEEIGENQISVFVWIFFIVGIALVASARKEDSELEIKVFDRSNGKDNNHDRSYVIEDVYNGDLGGGQVTLGEFKTQIKGLRDAGEELVDIVRDQYGNKLKELASSRAEHPEVAKEFLNVLGIEYENDNGTYELPKTYRMEIKTLFGSYDGKITKSHKDLFSRCNLSYDPGKTHNKLTATNGKTFSFPKSPSDHRGGKNLAMSFIHFLEDNKIKPKEN